MLFITAETKLGNGDGSMHEDSLCPMAIIAKCKDPCLTTAGRGAMGSVQVKPQQRISIVNALEFLNWYADNWLLTSDLEVDEIVGQLSETERARIRRVLDIAEGDNK